MYIGLIIVFESFEIGHCQKEFVRAINAMTNVKICLVCNSNDEALMESLSELVHKCHNTDVVNINRKKSSKSAVRLGARYLSSTYNVKHLGFVVGLKNYDITQVLQDYIKSQEDILNLNSSIKENKPIKQTFNQSLFSITDYLDKLISNKIIQATKIHSGLTSAQLMLFF